MNDIFVKTCKDKRVIPLLSRRTHALNQWLNQLDQDPLLFNSTWVS
ncbi:hypothetical protein [cyanobacterium endosymbiont of Rhopalodia gibberula]|nr:hypothetical protein [cyanobacterium endosymbiont of Rhopalodia gibberula]